jgi:amidohydrolase
LLQDVIALRRALHRIPELSFAEHRTSAFLKEAFGAIGLADRLRPIAGTGLVLDIAPRSGRPEARLLLRADMDALPITELTGLPFASTHAGCMHACGHDAHMASLAVAAARLVAEPPERVAVRVLFQPAEEGGGGALACIRDGVLDGVDMAFGVHVWNELPTGKIVLTTGGVMAGVVAFTVEVHGQGGHGAIPHLARDPVVAAAELILAFQTIASRRVAPVEPVVVTVGSVHGGDAFNVIPGVVKLSGTVRAYDTATLDHVEVVMREIAAGIGLATGTRIEVGWTRTSRPTVNDGAAVAIARAAALQVGGPRLEGYRTMAGEDFGEILNLVPGCFVLIGSGDPEAAHVEPHHSPRFAIDERVLDVAERMHRAVVAVADGDPAALARPPAPHGGAI